MPADCSEDYHLVKDHVPTSSQHAWGGMKEECIFCLRELTDLPNDSSQATQEHVVPVSLGGSNWITTRRTCKACNSVLGDDVDTVVDIPLLATLRAEAGLVPRRALRGVYIDPDSGEIVPGRMRFDGVFEEQERVWQQDNRIRGAQRSLEAARAAIERITERRRREGQRVTFAAPQMLPERTVTAFVDLRSTRVDELNELMVREAAKMAIGYVAHIAGPEIAMAAPLDPIRACALMGAPITSTGVEWLGPELSYLPHCGRYLMMGESGESPSYEDAAQMQSQHAAVTLTELVHHLGVQRGAEGSFFVVVLFSWLRVGLALPGDLLLPWGRVDYRNLRSGQTGVARVEA
jgi:hypothetical protein